jgi:transposase-like protein
MKENTSVERRSSSFVFGQLEEMAREQIQGWLQSLLEEEVTEFLGRVKSERVNPIDGKTGYRNGYGKERRLATTFGTLVVRRPRLKKSSDPFESRVLPLFVKRTHEVAELLPELYLHGLAQGDFELAMRGLLGQGAPLSEASIARLKERWKEEFSDWSKRPLAEEKIVYVWADGVYVKAGLEKDKAAVLVIIGARENGTKTILAMTSGHRESEEGWAEMLRDLKARGLQPPRMLCADGALGIWTATTKVWPETDQQRCWNHKIRNVVDKFPKREQKAALQMLKAIPYASTKKDAERQRDQFVSRYEASHPKAAQCLLQGWDRLVAFFAFPKEHWNHLRTTNAVESPFAAVRLRTDAAKRFKKVENATAMLWKLLLVAEKSFRHLNARELLPAVRRGQRYLDGEPIEEQKGLSEPAKAA